jgi:hypothetical protein
MDMTSVESRSCAATARHSIVLRTFKNKNSEGEEKNEIKKGRSRQKFKTAMCPYNLMGDGRRFGVTCCLRVFS